MRRPTSRTNDGEHPARFRVWLRNGGPESVPSTFNCFVSKIDWDRRWQKFENGVEPICVCEDAARDGYCEVVWLEPSSRPSPLPVPVYASRSTARAIVRIVNNAINHRSEMFRNADN